MCCHQDLEGGGAERWSGKGLMEGGGQDLRSIPVQRWLPCLGDWLAMGFLQGNADCPLNFLPVVAECPLTWYLLALLESK